MKCMLRIAGVCLLVFGLSMPAAAQDREPPYWASISATRAHMRTGPGRNFPISWLYQRADLPVRVVEIYKNWRKIEDPDGVQGWMLVNLLSAQRTAIIAGGTHPLRSAPEPRAAIRYRAEAGVVGQIHNCGRGWCEFDVHGRRGYVEIAHLFGVTRDEEVD